MPKMRVIRMACGLSVEQLAAIVGVTKMSIYRYEQGLRIPDVAIAAKIAAALGCTIEDLIDNKKAV